MTKKKSKARLIKPKQLREKEMVSEAAMAQFAMHGTPHTQRLYGVRKSRLVEYAEELRGKKRDAPEVLRTVKLEHIHGVKLGTLCKSKKGCRWLQKNKEEIIDQLTQFLVDCMKRGVIHRDLHENNIIISRRKDKLRLKIIDFAEAESTRAAVRKRVVGGPEWIKAIMDGSAYEKKGPEFAFGNIADKIKFEIESTAEDIAEKLYKSKKARERFKGEFFEQFEEKIKEQM